MSCENRAFRAESKAADLVAQLKAADMKATQAEARAAQAEARATQAEARATQAEARAAQAQAWGECQVARMKAQLEAARDRRRKEQNEVIGHVFPACCFPFCMLSLFDSLVKGNAVTTNSQGPGTRAPKNEARNQEA